MATLTGKLVSETYKALLKMIDNDILTESEKQISDGFGQGTGIFIDDNGFIRASIFKVTGGSSSQFLKADGSLDSNSYLTAAAASALYLTRTEADGLYLAIGSTTSAIAEGSRLYFTTGRVLATTLTGFVPITGTVTAADTVLTSIEKIWWNIINGGGGGGGYVPYTGATQNLNLGTFGLISDFIQFNLAPTSIPTTAGTMSWNNIDGTVDLKLKGGNVTLQLGQEQVVRVVNKTGANLTEAAYKVVRVRNESEGGSQGQRLAVLLAQADSKVNHTGILGIVTENITNNQEGFVTSFGEVRNIDTTGDLQDETWADGDALWLSETVAGQLTNIEPETHPVQIGYVLYAHQNNGKIYVYLSEGVDELNELHDVQITDETDEDVLFYDEVESLWINKNIYSAINATDVGKSLLAILNAEDTVPVTTKPRGIRINVDNSVDALDVGTQGYLPFYDDTDFYIDSPIFVDEDGKVIVNGETGFYDFTVIGELKADNLYVNTFSKIIAETFDDSLSFNVYDGTDWIQSLRLFNDGTIKQLIVTNTLIGTTSTGVLRAGTKADIETILGAPAISGSLTENYIPIATDVDSITDSIIYQDGTNLVINGTTSAYKLQVNGTFSADELYVFGTGRITPNLVSGYVTHSVINSSTFNNVLRLHKNQDIQQFKITNGIVYADDFGYLAKATSGQIIAGLGFVPYNSTNPDGFIAPGTFFATNPLIWDQFTNTISMSQASDLNNGWLSASDWTTFNNKGGGSVSSVSATVPTGFAISGSPITTSGTLGITFASGYSLPTNVKQSNWDDAYTFVAGFPTQTGNAGKYLTTDGSSLSWGTVTAGVSSFNTRTGAVTLTSTDVTTALGYTPVTQARTLTINGTTYDLSADRAWTVSAGSSARNVSTFTATAGQTTFTITGGYTPNLVDVFLNGVRLTGVDFTATNGTTIVLTEGVRVNDIIDVVNYLNAATLGVTGSGTSGYLPKWTGTSVVSNSLIYETNSSIGIGTITPDLYGFGSSGRYLTLQSGSGGFSLIQVISDSTSGSGINFGNTTIRRASIDGLDGSNLIFSTNASNSGTSVTERMRITSAGNIGIGVSSPETYSLAGKHIELFGGSSYSFYHFNTNTVKAFLSSNESAGSSSLFTFSNHPLFLGTNNTARMVINTSGNVGIGTSSPQHILHISGASQTTILKISSVDQASGTLALGDGLSTSINVGIWRGQPSSLSSGNTLNLGGYDGIAFTSGTTVIGSQSERMRITPTGNVGIGTTTPTGTYGKLSVAGGISILNDNNAKLEIGRYASFAPNSYIKLGPSSNALHITNNNDNVDIFCILNSGIVGIGTVQPSAGFGGTIANVKLALLNGTAGSAGGTSVLLIGGDNNHYSSITAEHTGGGNTYLAFGTSTGAVNPSEKMRIDANGNVMINTTSVLDKLSINGGVRTTGSGSGFFFGDRSSSNFFGWYAAGNNPYLFNGAVGNIASINPSNGAYTALSDVNKKKNFEKSKYGLAEILLLNPQLYNLKIDNEGDKKDLGFIAQEIKNIIPQAYIETDDFIGLNYQAITATSVKAIQELDYKFETQAEKIARLETRVQQLEAK
jgi:hypothetical protein